MHRGLVRWNADAGMVGSDGVVGCDGLIEYDGVVGSKIGGGV